MGLLLELLKVSFGCCPRLSCLPIWTSPKLSQNFFITFPIHCNSLMNFLNSSSGNLLQQSIKYSRFFCRHSSFSFGNASFGTENWANSSLNKFFWSNDNCWQINVLRTLIWFFLLVIASCLSSIVTGIRLLLLIVPDWQYKLQ